MERFSRTTLILGKEKQERLFNSRIVVAGCGAVGGYALEALARSGIGSIRLVDFDVFEISNINRQILALDSTIGKKKVSVAADRVHEIHPACKVEEFDLFICKDNLQDFLLYVDNDTNTTKKPTIVIDAIDFLPSKIEMLTYCWNQEIPVVSSMGAALRTDPFAIRRADIMNTHTCPMARTVRSSLKKHGVGTGITAIYSVEKPVPLNRNLNTSLCKHSKMKTDTSISEMDQAEFGAQSQKSSSGREKKVLGSLPTITGMFGLQLAQAALDRILE